MPDPEPEKKFTLRCNLCGSEDVFVNVSIHAEVQFICNSCGRILGDA